MIGLAIVFLATICIYIKFRVERDVEMTMFLARVLGMMVILTTVIAIANYAEFGRVIL